MEGVGGVKEKKNNRYSPSSAAAAFWSIDMNGIFSGDVYCNSKKGIGVGLIFYPGQEIPPLQTTREERWELNFYSGGHG